MKKSLLPVLFLFLFATIGFCPKAYAEVKLDSLSNPTPQGTSNTATAIGFTWQHTVGNFPNRLLLVSVNYSGYGVTVTYNGVQMQQVVGTGFAGISPFDNLGIWYLQNPPVGPGTIKLTSISAGTVAGAASYYNVDQTTPFGNTAKTSGSSGPATKTSTVTVANTTVGQLVVDALGSRLATANGTKPTPGSGQISTWFNYGSDTGQVGIGSYKPATAGSTATSWTFVIPSSSADSSWGQIAVALNPAADALPTPTPTPTTYSISGNVYLDNNKNRYKDTGDTNVTGTPNMSITPNAGTITANPDGTYIIAGLPAGTYLVSYNGLQPGYQLTSPVNGPPPSYQVTVGPGCDTNGAPGARCQ